MVVHHDHITGYYISTLCKEYNLKYQYKKFLPVYIRNLKGYNSHFSVPYLNKYGFKFETEAIIFFMERLFLSEIFFLNSLTFEYYKT